MFLHFLGAIAGMNFSYAPGDVVEWSDQAEAERMVSRGIAEEILPDEAQRMAATAKKPLRRHRPDRLAH